MHRTEARLDPLLQRHITRCNDAVLPGDRIALHIGEALVGWMSRAVAAVVATHPAITTTIDHLRLGPARAGELSDIVETLAARGLCRIRGEMFDVRPPEGGVVLAQVDRGALPALGIAAEGVHVNGLVTRPDGVHLWVAVRARTKLLDPGKFDHIVAGGISAGMNPADTLVKEAGEEAGMSPDLARRAVKVGTLAYAMNRPEGLRRDILHCFDLELPDTFTPRPADGEVERFELWPIDRVLAAVRTTDDFKFNVNLVLIDLFRRRGLA